MQATLVKRIAAAAVCAVLVAYALASCGSPRGGLDAPSGKTALTVGGYAVTEDEYNYYFFNYVNTDGLSEAEAKEAALGDLRRNCAVLSLASEYGVTLSDAGRENVRSYTEAMMEGVGTDAFAQGMDDYRITNELFLYLMELGQLETELRDYAFEEKNDIIRSDDKTVEKDIAENFVAVKQILVAKGDGDDAQKRGLAEEIAARLDAGEDFDVLCSEYNEDDKQDAEYGRCFTRGMYPEGFEDAACALAVGERSGVVETGVGYHIIKRLAIDPEYVDANFETLRYYYKNRVFNDMLAARADGLEAEWK